MKKLILYFKSKYLYGGGIKSLPKKIIVVLMLCPYIFSSGHAKQATKPTVFTNLSGQDSTAVYSRPYILKTNLTGPFSLLYELQIQRKHSVQLSVNRLNYSVILGGDIKYFALTPAYKFYLSKRYSTAKRPYPSGFYLSPYLRYVSIREVTTGFIAINERRSESAYNLFGGGATAGYQTILRRGLTLDFFAGGGYLPLGNSRIVYTQQNYISTIRTKDFMPDFRLGLCIGFAFKEKP